MMQAAQIPLGHLYSTGVHPVHEYSPQEDEMINLLFNKDQYLKDQQYAQVGKLMASVRQPEVTPPLQAKAMERINKYQSDLLDLYKTQKDKRKLSGDNILKAKQLEYGLNFDLSAMKQITDDFDKSQTLAARWAGEGMLSQQEEADALTKWKNDIADPKRSLADTPSYTQVLRTIVEPKIKAKAKDDTVRKAIELETLQKNLISAGNEGQDNKVKFDPDKADRIVAATNPDHIALAFGDAKTYRQRLEDSWKQKTASVPNYIQINNAQKNAPVDIEPVVNPDINGKTFPLNEIPTPWNGQHTYTDEAGKSHTTTASGHITQIDRTPDKMTATINVKFKKGVYSDGTTVDPDGNTIPKGKPIYNKNGSTVTEESQDIKVEQVTPNLISKLKKMGYDTGKLQTEYDDFVKNKTNKTPKSDANNTWIDGSGNEYSLKDIQDSWKSKFKRGITNDELEKVLINLKRKH